jgi:RsiW-degrading membrane proteinase PrsW (M82 family)
MQSAILLAIIGGVVPTFIWLWFWLKENTLHPEPRRMIVKSFLGGMVMVPVAFVFQQFVMILLADDGSIETIVKKAPQMAILIIALWAFIEEALKLIASYITGLRTKENHEPIDSVIYLITTAIGFAAAENTLFLLGPLLAGESFTAIITGNLRFMGATLLHIACSGVIGIFVAFSFYKHGRAKKRIVWTSLILAFVLHLIFNLFIIFNASHTFLSFALVWAVIVLIILMLEKVKQIPTNQ